MAEQEKTSGATQEWLPVQMRDQEQAPPASVEPGEWPVPPSVDSDAEDHAESDGGGDAGAGEETAEVADSDAREPAPVELDRAVEEDDQAREADRDEHRAEMTDSIAAVRGHVEQELQTYARGVEESDAAAQRTLGGFGERLTALEGGLAQLLASFERERVSTQELIGTLSDELGTRNGEAHERINALDRRVEETVEQMGERIAGIENEAQASRAHQVERLGALEEGLDQLLASFEHESATSQEVLRALAEELGTRSGESREQLRSLDRRLEVLRTSLEDRADGRDGRLAALERGAEEALELNAEIEQRIKEGLAESSGSVASLTKRLEDLAGSVEGEVAARSRVVTGISEELAARGSQVEERIGSIDERLQGITAAMQRLELSSGRSDPAVEGLRTAIGALEVRLQAHLGELGGEVEQLNRAASEGGGRAGDVTVIEGPAVRPADSAIPARAPSGASSDVAASEPPSLDVNRASFEDLRHLGLTITQAARVITLRDKRGGYDSLDDLDLVPGLPDALREELGRRFFVSRS